MSKEAITLTESKRLIQLEKIIKEGERAFVDVGNALLEIRDEKLYRADHNSFDDYCQEKWGWNRDRGYKLIIAAQVFESLPKSVSHGIQNERQARELAKIPPPSRAKVLEKIQKAEEPVTAKTIAAHIPPPRKQTVIPPKSKPAPKPAPKVEPPKVTDTVGRVIPDALLGLWERSHEVQELINLLQRAKNEVSKAEKEKDPLYSFLNFQRTIDGLANALAELKGIKLYSLCVECHGKMTETCTACRHTGFIGKFTWDHQSKEESKAMILKTLKK